MIMGDESHLPTERLLPIALFNNKNYKESS